MKNLFSNIWQKIVWIIYIILCFSLLTTFTNEGMRNYAQYYVGPYLVKLIKIIGLGIIAIVLASILADKKEKN